MFLTLSILIWLTLREGYNIVKTALSLNQEVIFPNLHFTHLNPNIDLGHAPIRVPTTHIPWPRSQQRRMAGVNSFGYSGTNAHALLQEAPLFVHDDAHRRNRKSLAERSYEMLVLSATSVGCLQELADKWTDFLERYDSTEAGQATELGDIAFTAAIGRTHLSHRLAVVGQTRNEISEKLRSWREGHIVKRLAYRQVTRRKQKIAFVFTGQGAQYANMGQQLYKIEPRFAQAIDRCASFMDAEIGLPLRDILFGPSSAALLENTRYAQPALFAIEYALADLLCYWGVEPDYVIGHSIGEVVAACVACILSLEDAAKFVVARGRLMGHLPRDGKMLAIDATIEQIQEWIRGKEADVSIATVNGLHAFVVSGRIAAVDAVAQLALATGRRTRELDVSHAFHSPLMDPILAELTTVARSLGISPAKIPLASNVTGDFLNDDISAEYWSSHVRQPVLFYNGMRQIIEAGCSVIVEVGPHPTLTPAIATTFDMSKLRSIQTLTRDQQDNANIFETLASLYVNGVSLNLDRLFRSPLYHRISLPLYPFRRDRHWAYATSEVDNPDMPELKLDLHPLLGRTVTVSSRRIVFETSLSTTHPWTDHRVLGATVFPGTAYLEMVARGFAAFSGQNWRSVVLQNVVFERPLLLIYGKPKKVSLTLDNLTPKAAGETTFVIAATRSGNSENYCRGRITATSETRETVSVEAELSRRESKLEIGPFYGELRKSGLEYGASFATVRELWQGKPSSGEAIGRITISPHNEGADHHPFTNALLLDGSLQVLGAALKTLGSKEPHGAFIPASIESVTLRSQFPPQVWSHANVHVNNDGQAALVRIRIWNESSEVLADINGLEVRYKMSFASTPKGLETVTSTTVSAGEQSSAYRFESRDQLIGHLQKLPKCQHVQMLTKWLASEVKDIMGRAAEELDLDNIDPSTAFLEIGLDSLLVTELQRRIQEKLAFRFQPMQGLDYQSIESLAEYILDEVLVLGQIGDAPTGQRETLAGKSDM